MRKYIEVILITIIFTSCVMDSDELSTEFQIWNKSGYSPVVGLFFKSSIWKDNIDSSYVNHDSINYNIKEREYLQQCDKIPLNWGYYWPLWLGDHDGFENAYNFYQTDTMSVLFTTSEYNLRKWFSTHDDVYIVDKFSFSKDEVRDSPNRYELVYNPPSGCCIYIDGIIHEKLCVGMYFYPAATGIESGKEQVGLLSIIGEYNKQETANNGTWQSVNCPLGYSEVRTFGDFFKKCKTDEIQILVSESEAQLIEWEKSQNESLLLYKEKFTLEQLGTANNSIRIELNL